MASRLMGAAPAAPQEPPPLHDWYLYTFEPGVLAAGPGGGQGVAVQLAIDSQSDFRWYGISSYAVKVNAGGATGQTARFSVHVEDSSRAVPFMPNNIFLNGELFSSNALAGIFGGGSIPNMVWLPRPYRLPRQTVLNAIFNNREGTQIQIQLALLGYKVTPQ